MTTTKDQSAESALVDAGAGSRADGTRITFSPVPKKFDLPSLERETLDFWARNDVERRYLERNDHAEDRFSFLDGPITANGPMGVHHAWGRTYKDLWQRYNTMLGKRQRYQNGFDCQGLWVEVVTERMLGFKSKRDIESYGIADFVRKCKESVFHWSAVQTDQSKRLGYFMDWDNSYYTLSDDNNYTIWYFLRACHERGLLYRGTDVMTWCSRCGTAISDAEAAEGYQDLTHTAVFVRLLLTDQAHEYLLVWTTTPWTLTSNVAVAVNPELAYVKVRQGDNVYYIAEGALPHLRGSYEVLEKLPGSALVGWTYAGPFDDLPAEAGVQHVVIPWDEVTPEEGTGLVHIAPGCGTEDFRLSKEFDLPVVAPLDQNGVYVSGFGFLEGKNVQDVTDAIVENLRDKGILYAAEQYAHRYPTCWRCGTELVWRLVDEWFISMDPLREPMMEVVRNIRWLPGFGLDRELDWLRNMGDWMISKKRYWGLALPFWVCPSDHLTVIGSKQELFERASGGLADLESPHRPWIDDVTIVCDRCGETATRVLDVGNPWLDAGIVPFSTLQYNQDPVHWRTWFPADFITESFPGQFRNWFYSLLAMSTVLTDSPPFKTVLGYATVHDEQGREMHKSWGNVIPFDEAAERSGADVMRWLFVKHNPELNLNFGWESLDEVKRRLLTLWNTYSFFVMYATVDGWTPAESAVEPKRRPLLDRWILARLNQVVADVRSGLDRYDAMSASRSLDRFIEELSTWYVRRSRRRFWKASNDSDKLAAYSTLYETLTALTGLLAPFMPFLSEHLYQNLVRAVSPSSAVSVHLTDYPEFRQELADPALVAAMDVALEIVALGRAARDRSGIKVRQPVAGLYVRVPDPEAERYLHELQDIVLDELNAKKLEFVREGGEFVEYEVRPNLPGLGPKYGRMVPAIGRALEAQDRETLVGAVDAGQAVELEIDGQRVELAPGDVLVTAREREGYAAMSSGAYLVALDTHLTPELIAEGLARDVVRRINEWRKEAGFDVADRITVHYRASESLADAILRHQSAIQEEVLATELVPGTAQQRGYTGHATFSGERLEVDLTRGQSL